MLLAASIKQLADLDALDRDHMNVKDFIKIATRVAQYIVDFSLRSCQNLSHFDVFVYNFVQLMKVRICDARVQRCVVFYLLRLLVYGYSSVRFPSFQILKILMKISSILLSKRRNLYLLRVQKGWSGSLSKRCASRSVVTNTMKSNS